MSYERVPNDDEPRGVDHEIELPQIGHQVAGNIQAGHQVAFAPVVPPVPTREQLEFSILNRQIQFSSEKFLTDGWRFYRINACGFCKIALLLIVQMVILGFLTAVLAQAVLPNDSQSDSSNDAGTNGYHGNFQWIHHGPAHLTHRLFHTYSSNDMKATHSSSSNGTVSAHPHAHSFIIGIFQFIETFTLYMPLVAGAWFAVFQSLRYNSRISLGDFYFAFSNYYPKLVRLTFFMTLLRFILFRMLIIPGLIFCFFTMFALPLHREHNLRACAAMSLSAKVVKRSWCKLLLFAVICFIINMLGLMILGLGVFVTVPVTFLAFCYCYQHLVGINGVPVMVPQPAFQPPQPPQPTPPQQNSQATPSTPSSASSNLSSPVPAVPVHRPLVTGIPVTDPTQASQPAQLMAEYHTQAARYYMMQQQQQPQQQSQQSQQQSQPPVYPMLTGPAPSFAPPSSMSSNVTPSGPSQWQRTA